VSDNHAETQRERAREKLNGQQAAGPGRQHGQNQQGKKSKNAATGFRFAVVDSAMFDAADYRPEWAVKGALVRGQPAVIGGPLKCMKTSLSLDLGISLGSATPFLGHFQVYQKSRTVILGGESGQATLQNCARRICWERGISLADCDLFWGFRLPKLASVQDLRELQRGLKNCGAENCILDPLYLSLLTGDDAASASNFYATGPLLLAAAEACLDVGVTPIVCHHFRRSIPQPPAKPELTWLSHSGIAEFARQWLLLSRRQEYDEDSGFHELWLAIGGSVGHSCLHALDIDEGRMADDFSGRTWKVTVQPGREAHLAQQTKRATEKDQKRAGRDKTNEARLLNTLDHLAGKTENGFVGYTKLRSVAGLGGDGMTRAVSRLVDEGILEEVPTMYLAGKGATRAARGIRSGSLQKPFRGLFPRDFTHN
jgi:hypothetical protein